MGETPLEVAARWGHVKMVEFLIASFDFSTQSLKKAKEKALNIQIKKMFESRLKGKIQNEKASSDIKNGFWRCGFLC